jgi:DNA repair photolyase
MRVASVPARSILTPTGGFLLGFTHTLNPYRGCSFGGALCGVYCYASETRYGQDRSEPWGSYVLAKEQAAELYRTEAAALRANGAPLRIFMSSVTDPYLPQERRLSLTRAILEAMTAATPDLLVLQTHTAGPLRDLDLLVRIAERGRVVVQITVETDRARLPGLPAHATPIATRIETLGQLRAAGLPTIAVVSPLLPLDDERRFAATLGEHADAVILDHYLLGDGSKDGARTKRPRVHAPRTLPLALEQEGLGEWATLSKFWQVVDLFRAILGSERVGVSQEGFRRACTPDWPPRSGRG